MRASDLNTVKYRLGFSVIIALSHLDCCGSDMGSKSSFLALASMAAPQIIHCHPSLIYKKWGVQVQIEKQVQRAVHLPM